MIYWAFTDPDELLQSQAPDKMTATINEWDHRPGGRYTLSLSYPGKSGDGYAWSGEGEDR
ncbi:MAG TPA: hypothetical protein VGT61_15470 [Thermomicrobiales bacterium]|nr:hypothetical protein [Thermomicrobiales bacterium]